MLWLALMPLHACPKRSSEARLVSRKHFQFNLISASIGSVNMMATAISGSRERRSPPVMLCALLCLAAGWWSMGGSVALRGQSSAPAEAATNSPTYFALLAENAYRTARARFLAETNNAEAGWQLGRACFDRAEFGGTPEQIAALALEGIAVCRPLAVREPKLAAAHYYLSMNLGQLARTRSLGALPLVDEMERHFHLARELQPVFDHAGPDRCLGLLYRDAPVWPLSVGSRVKARRHLARAVELAPQLPENHLNLLESFLKWSEPNNAQRQWQSLLACLPAARTNFTGPGWGAAWVDWNRRQVAIASKLPPLAR